MVKTGVDTMITVGISGGIGSGKSTVCTEWEKLGARILYADDLAKKLMVEDAGLIREIRKLFGDESYFTDGALNKEWLAREAFEKGRVNELNALVHPAVFRKTDELMQKAHAEKVPLFVKEAALLLQNGRPEGLDFVVLVLAPENKRIDRVINRDRTSKEKVQERIQKQQDFETLKPLADFIIENDVTIDELKKKSRDLFKKITS